jgi:uncharacterized membrane protein YhaH (DUF805 family)
MKLLQPNFSWQQFLLSWHGRVPRRQYWVLYTLFIYAPIAIVAYVVDSCLGMGEAQIAPASIAASIITIWPNTVILIKRLHDINLSAWQYCKPALIGLAVVALGMGLMMLKKDMLQQDPTLKWAFGCATAVLAIPFFMYFFWLNLLALFKPSQIGDNRFGPDIRAQILDQNKATESDIKP